MPFLKFELKRVTALKFGKAIALIRYNEELGRNGGRTAVLAENHHFCQNLFCYFLSN